jgi:hypothetical protein
MARNWRAPAHGERGPESSGTRSGPGAETALGNVDFFESGAVGDRAVAMFGSLTGHVQRNVLEVEYDVTAVYDCCAASPRIRRPDAFGHPQDREARRGVAEQSGAVRVFGLTKCQNESRLARCSGFPHDLVCPAEELGRKAAAVGAGKRGVKDDRRLLWAV